jgi:tetratricopeptide (TPR) repeat protein
MSCYIRGGEVLCPASTSFTYGGVPINIDASIACPLNSIDQTQFTIMSQKGDCTCDATIRGEPPLNCECYVCPDDSRNPFGYICQEFLVGDCSSFSCDIQCNGEDVFNFAPSSTPSAAISNVPSLPPIMAAISNVPSLPPTMTAPATTTTAPYGTPPGGNAVGVVITATAVVLFVVGIVGYFYWKRKQETGGGGVPTDTTKLVAELDGFEDNEAINAMEPAPPKEHKTAAQVMTATNDDSSVFPKAGVRLSYIVGEFYEECGGREALKGLTTKQVCEQFIKPKTQERKSSYCDLLKDQGHKAYRETAQVFLSHAHGCEFLTVVDALQWHFRDQPDTVIWFDLFSINQHQPMDWTFEWLSTTFKSSIQKIGRTIMPLSPWNDPVPFTRAWCIFEVYCTAEADNKFEIAMGEGDRRKFLEDVRKDPDNCINQMLATIRAEKSQCFSEDQRKRIFSVIQETVGFAEIDSLVFEQYRDWVISVANDALDDCIEDLERLDLLEVVGMLYLGQGNYSEAAPFLKECFDKRTSILGENHPDTLKSMHNLAVLCDKKGEYDQAHPLYVQCLEKRKSTLGENHLDTLNSMNNLAGLYKNQGLYDKAYPLCIKCLEERKSTLGDNHSDTLESINSLAVFYHSQGRYDKASPLYEECLEQKKSTLGVNHPSTLSSMNNLALLYYSQGQYDKALPLYKTCLEQTKSILGESHPDTLTSINNLALLYDKQGEHDQARSLSEAFRLKKQAR